MLDTENMVAFTVYRPADGTALRGGFAGSRATLAAQCQEGEALLVGVCGKAGDIVENGELIECEVAPETITIDMVKAEMSRRLTYSDGYVTRAADPTDGRPVPEAILAERAAIRSAAAALEAMEPIPNDYRDEHFWC